MVIMKVIRDNISKKNIINNIFNEIGVPINYAAKLVDDLILILIENINAKKKIKIKNFGTFFLLKKKKRIGRNPKNKIDHIISERNVISFKISNELKNKLNINVGK
jgi:integration host factor subunit alpha